MSAYKCEQLRDEEIIVIWFPWFLSLEETIGSEEMQFREGNRGDAPSRMQLYGRPPRNSFPPRNAQPGLFRAPSLSEHICLWFSLCTFISRLVKSGCYLGLEI